jgi:fumagillin biosynthesis cytochrome P450 monooxygenase
VPKLPGSILELLLTESYRQSSAIILKVTYGYSIIPSGADPLVQLIERMLRDAVTAILPMTWAVDILPWLKYLPSSCPGSAFKETARQWNKIAQDVVNIPYSFVVQKMESGSYRDSYVSRLLEQCSDGSSGIKAQLSVDDDRDIKQTAASLYMAGAETTSSTMDCFILAMLMFPEVQAKAQKEIDDVIGSDRLPCLEDRKNLPFIEGLLTEVYRWLPVLPMGLPRMAENDIKYNGYQIPKGAYIIPSVWWLCHDPQTYANPDIFDAERYREPNNEPDPREVVFGFGRRICQGRFFADSTLFITIAQTLAVFSICKALDKDGQEIQVQLELVPSSITARPKEFEFRILPRSSRHEELLQKIEDENSWEESDAHDIPTNPI